MYYPIRNANDIMLMFVVIWAWLFFFFFSFSLAIFLLNSYHPISPLFFSSPHCFVLSLFSSRMEKSSNTIQRRLSLPDLQKLRQEWDKREAVQATAQLSPGKLQVRGSCCYGNMRLPWILTSHYYRLIYSMFAAMSQWNGHWCDFAWALSIISAQDQSMQTATGTKDSCSPFLITISCLIRLK